MFFDNFKDLCKKRGVTQVEAMDAIGISTGLLNKWKNGSIPRVRTLTAIADYFGVTVPDLLRGTAYETTEPADTRPHGVRIPVYGNVAAGIPIEAITDIEDYEDISEALAAAGEYIALRIHGHSMEPRMMEGDVVIVRLQETVDNGQIAIVMVDGSDATCKRVRLLENGLMLQPLNPSYEPLFYTAEQVENLPVRILGRVVEIRCKL